MYSFMVKRMFDIITALVGLILTSPMLLVVAIIIRVRLGHPILFRQVRPGLHGKPFVMCKFRTMLDLRDKNGSFLPDNQRLTRIGRFLRSISLDELPQLINVLKGEMSLVGPRPLLMEYLDRYTPEQARRHNMKPGITGWAQVNGRNAISWEERFKLDVWYIDNWSLWLDLKIICLTLIKAFRREGICANGYSTMPKFMGSGKHERM